MTAAEARKKQWESLKDKPLQDKLRYIFTYYWPGIVGGLCALIFLVSWIGNILLQKDVALGGHFINGVAQSSYAGNLRQDFIDLYLDGTQQDFTLTTDSSMLSDSPMDVYNGMNAIVTRIAVGDVDFMVGDLATYTQFTAYFADLRNVLTSQQLEQYKDSFVYVEKEALEALTSDNFEIITIPEYFLSADGLKDPIPLGIRLPANCKLLQAYKFPAGEVIFGIPQSAQNIDNAMTFLAYVTN